MANPIDTLKPAHHSLLNDVVGTFRHMFGVQTPAEHEQKMHANPEAQALFDVKKNILAQVRANVAEGERPTLEQYRLACEAYAQTDAGKAMAAEHHWNPKIYADLSGQDLSGFTITEPKKLTEVHHLDQKIEAPQEEEAHGHHIVRANYDSHDRDGDGQINVAATHSFYDNIRFDKADLHGAFVEPATSFNDEIAKAENLKDMTFNGMSEGDKFVFRSGQHENARMTNIDGGEIVFAHNSQVNGVSIEGAAAKITIGDHAVVNHIEVGDEFRIIKLEMGKHSVISNSDLGQSTVSMTSHFEPGATFQNVNLSGNLAGLDFSGLKLNNVTIDGKPITHASQLSEYGITHDAHTIATASQGQIGQAPTPAAAPDSLAAIRSTMQQALRDIGKPLNTQEMAALQVTQAQREARQQEQSTMLPGRKV